MLHKYYIRSGKRLFISLRRFSDDPAKTFQAKGLSEENRYFLKKQEEELKRLREQLLLLARNQEKLVYKLDQANKALEGMGETKSQEIKNKSQKKFKWNFYDKTNK